jgi:hypothetical protein
LPPGRPAVPARTVLYAFDMVTSSVAARVPAGPGAAGDVLGYCQPREAVNATDPAAPITRWAGRVTGARPSWKPTGLCPGAGPPPGRVRRAGRVLDPKQAAGG